MTTPRLPDSPGPATLSALIPAQRSAPAGEHVRAGHGAPNPDRDPVVRDVVSPGPAVAGRDTRLAVLWTLLGAVMGAAALVVLALALPLL